jgi:hypothetical protein
LAIPLDKFSFLFEANQLKGFSVHPDLQDDADCWQFWRIAISDQERDDPHGADRYPVALAIKSKNREEITGFHSVRCAAMYHSHWFFWIKPVPATGITL